jgi:creatinine amidohydrolase
VITNHARNPRYVLMAGCIISDITTTDTAATAPVAVQPVGGLVQHGPYLPLGTGTLIACAVATSIAQCRSVFQLPPSP